MRVLKNAGLNKNIRSWRRGPRLLTGLLPALIYGAKGWNIKRYALFIGYPRSGSTLLGALLNAHPEVVISHEAFSTGHDPDRHPRNIKNAAAIGKWIIVRRILDHDRSMTSYERMADYSYVVNGALQGRCTRLRVIGDKDSFPYTRCLYNWPWVLDSLRHHMGVPIRAFFTYRNPYDMLAAGYLRRLRNKRSNTAIPSSLLDYDPTDVEKLQMEQDFLSSNKTHLDLSRKLVEVLSLFSEDEIFPIKHEDFIASPRGNLRSVCEFLGVQCTEEYLKACATIVRTSPHKTRFKVRWTSEQKARVAEVIRKYPWFQDYTYED